MFKLSIATVVAFALLTGCSFDTEGTLSADGNLYERLGHRESLSLVEPSEVGVTAYDRNGATVPCIQPAVTAGDAVVRVTADELLLLEKLDIVLSDVVLKPGVVHPEQPIRLTDVRMRLGTQLVIEPIWSDDYMFAAGTGRADLLLDWAVLDDDGDVLPLATQKLRDVEFEVAARQTGTGEIVIDVLSVHPGTLWDFTAVEVADLDMAVFASNREVIQ